MINKVPILFSILFVLFALFFSIYLAKVKDAGKNKKKLFLYMAVTGILIGLVSFIGYIEFTKLSLWIFIGAQLWLLAIGILHALFFEEIIELDNRNTGKILFTLALCFFGFGVLVLSHNLLISKPFPRVYLFPALFFLAPTFVIIAFNYFVKIPVKVYKAWDFPPAGTLSDPSDNEMADPIIVNFGIRKQCTDSRTIFKAKAPIGMELGRLFYFFVMDYNSRHPENPVLIEDNDHKPFRWSFFISGGIFSGKKHLDPEISVLENKIKENASVTCERIIL